MKMTKQELYSWFVRFGEFDVRVKKSVGGDEIYRAVFPKKFFEHEIGKDEIRWYVRQGWIAEKQISDGGVIRNVFYWRGEAMRQRSPVKAFFEKTGLSNTAKRVASTADHVFATFIKWLSWLVR